MLEEDTKDRFNIEKAFEEINSKIYEEIITCDEIEDIRKQWLEDNNENTWQTVNKKRGNNKKTSVSDSELYMREMLESKNSNNEINNKNLNKLEYKERFQLYWSWVEKYKLDKQKELEQLSRQHNQQAQIVQELKMQEDRHVLENAYIVAMTTTGSSRYHSVLKDIGPRIVIVEEAAEVFESHIVASLSKNCEHLILIGDHVQLRPSPTVYKLAKDFNFDVSLFERLINNNTKKVRIHKLKHISYFFLFIINVSL
jgi:hypothetical protein